MSRLSNVFTVNQCTDAFPIVARVTSILTFGDLHELVLSGTLLVLSASAEISSFSAVKERLCRIEAFHAPEPSFLHGYCNT
jgi:hypothetical protein